MKKAETKETELIIMAPMQIKKHLSLGNIYDLTIIDFYSKARKFLGYKTFLPFLWNINGDPLIKQMERAGFGMDNLNEFVDDSIVVIESELKSYYLDFDSTIRDDLVGEKIKNLIETSYKNEFQIGKSDVNECKSCGSIFGSDPEIKTCKNCGVETSTNNRTTLFLTVQNKDILEKLKNIEFIPLSVLQELKNFINKLPQKYDLILEKDRKYTISYKGFKLDPRFVAIMLPGMLDARKYKQRTWIHGDVIKKFDYYSLCYLQAEDCPTKIISHGVLLGEDKQKLRWQNNYTDGAVKLGGIDNKILRAYFLNFNNNKDRVFSLKNIQQESKGLIKAYVKINRVLELRNLEDGKNGMSQDLKNILAPFDSHISNFRYKEAFEIMIEYANWCWKHTKNNKITAEEQNTLRKLRSLFFGQ